MGGRPGAGNLDDPQGVGAWPDGGFVLIQRDRLRRVDPDGTISTLFVTGVSFNPDFPPPQPTALEVTEDGEVLIGLAQRVLRFDTNYAAAPPPPPPPPPRRRRPRLRRRRAARSPCRRRFRPGLQRRALQSSHKVTRGKRLALAFEAARAGRWALAVRRGKKVAKRFKGAANAGRNALKLRIKPKPGSYRLVLTLTAGAETTTDTAKLCVTRLG